MSNFGKKLSNYNDVTGNTIITSTKNQSIFEKNFEAIQDGSAALEAQNKQQVTMFPITLRIPQQVHKDLSTLAAKANKSVEELAQELFLMHM